MINKLPFVLWFVVGYVAFLIGSMLIAVYGYDARVGMEMQLYSAVFAVKLFAIMIMVSAVVAGAGFFIGGILSKCRRERWLGFMLGISYGAFALFYLVYARTIAISLGLGEYAGDLIWVVGFFGGVMLPFLVDTKQLTKNRNV